MSPQQTRSERCLLADPADAPITLRISSLVLLMLCLLPTRASAEVVAYVKPVSAVAYGLLPNSVECRQELVDRCASWNPEPCYVVSNWSLRDVQYDLDVQACQLRIQTTCSATCVCYCTNIEWIELPLPPKGDSAILVDLGEVSLRLTEPARGVNFDIDGDGAPEPVAWTDIDSEDAFLALDRNGDGAITSGLELFDSHTKQPFSPTPNGYEALRVYDRPESGGNGDGILSDRDAIWIKLLLWQDANHDGVSHPGELVSVSAKGVTSLSLRYRESRVRDQFGNEFRYRATVLLTERGRDSRRQSLDVFLQSYPLELFGNGIADSRQ